MEQMRGRTIAVDWGTTNRRAYLLDAGGALLDSMEDDRGVTTIDGAGFAAAIAEVVARLGDAPLMLAGMIGSSRGWREVPYIACPASLRALARAVEWVEPGRIGIVPGVAVKQPGCADVMRGEEVQVLGWLAANACGDALICHPGTHTKWVSCTGGAIAGFRTCMTGELYALLRDHSILGPLLQGEVLPDDDFLAGVEAGLAGGSLAAELFSARARVLLGQMDACCAAAWVSGLLVGADVAGARRFVSEMPRDVVVLGRPSLNRLYATALAHAGVRTSEHDGADAFIAGMNAIRENLP